MDQIMGYAPLAGAAAIIVLAIWALDKIPALKGLRTVITNCAFVLFLAIPAMLEFLTTVDWDTYLSAEHARWLVVGLALVNIYLRIAKTTTPFGKTTPDGQP